MKAQKTQSKKNRHGRLGTFVSLAVVCVVIAAAVFAVIQLASSDSGMLMSYEPENQADSISRSYQVDSELFASDLCVTDSTDTSDALDAGAALIFNITDGEVIYSQNVFDRLYPASLTKIMTYLVAAQYSDLSQMVTVTDAMLNLEKDSTLAGLKAGDVISMRDLLYGMMLVSGNDASQAIALTVGGTEEGFADLMNQKASELGATGTHFTNAHGLTDDQHYTTAYDIYLIFNEAVKDPEFVQLISAVEYTAYYTGPGGSAVEKTWTTNNGYLNGEEQVPDGWTVIGGKTGTTAAAGSCMALYSRDDDGTEYISVVLKAPSSGTLYGDLDSLFEMIS